jgi:uncharacterized protein (TIGR03437 family)
MNLFLSSKEAVIDLMDQKGRSAGVVHASLAGMSETAELLLGRPPDTMANYFVGADSKQWLTDIPVYSRVRYRNVYPGVDVEYHGENGQFEYDFIVSPSADPSSIRLQFKGAEDINVDDNGDLVLSAGRQKLTWRKPLLYQELPTGRQRVEGAYRKTTDGSVGFEVGVYDRRKPLVIDPVINYLTYVGRAGLDVITRAAIDSSGNTYFTGITRDASFPVSPGAFQSSAGGANLGNVLVAKLNATGTGVVYITHFGGANTDAGFGIAADSTGSVFIAGLTDSDNFPVTQGALKTSFTSQNPGASHCFVTKLNAAGSALLYSTYLGGRGTDMCFGIAVDSTGNAYVTGRTNSIDFPKSENAFQTTYRGGMEQSMISGTPLKVAGSDSFVTKLNPAGSAIVYSTYFGGSQNDTGIGIAVDAQGSAYVTGITSSINFPVTTGAFKTTYGGAGGQPDLVIGDAFVLKMNPGGTGLVYSTYLGGRFNDVGLGIAVDSQGSAHIVGSTLSTDFPTTPQSLQTAYRGAGGENRIASGDAFVTKLNPAGSGLVYSTYLGGARDDRATAISLDAGGNAWITGNTLSSDFPTTADGTQRTYAGEPSTDQVQIGDAFLTQLDSTGRAIRFSTYIGGKGGDLGSAIGIEPGGSVFVAGLTSSADLPATPGAYQRSFFGTSGLNMPIGDAFVARFGEQQPLLSIGGVASAASYAGGTVAPGEIVVLGGNGIGPATLAGLALTAAGDVATTVAETRILFDNIPAPLIYVSATQSSAIVPYEVAGRQSSQVVVEYRGNRSAPSTVTVVASKPALFSANASGRGQGAILNQDATYNSTSNPAEKGSIIAIFGTGEGQTNPPGVNGRIAQTVFPKPVLPVSVTIGDIRIDQLEYAGAAPSGVAGFFQINVKIPENAPSGDVPITVTAGSATSQSGLTVAIR